MGGESRRMGTPKALVEVGGKTLLERAVATLQELRVPVSVVMAPDQDFDARGLRVLRDIVPGLGPMGGLWTALNGSTAALNLILGCDLPRVGSDLFATLHRFREGFDIVAPIDTEGRVHPLCALYHKTCRTEVERRIGVGNRKMEDLLRTDRLRCRLVGPNEHALPDWRFTNVNSPADLARLRAEGDESP